MQRWNGSTRAHRTVAVPRFQIFWMPEGPTGPVGNLSLISISEHQIDYIISVLGRMKTDGLAAIAARKSAFEDYNLATREAIKSTAWYTGRCNSWYIDKSGLPNLYPCFPPRYLKEMHSPVFSEYRMIQMAACLASAEQE